MASKSALPADLPGVSVREARAVDASRVAAIYNEAIAERFRTFDSFPVTEDHYSAFFVGAPNRTLLVAEADRNIVGWASVYPVSDRWAYRLTAVGSTYVAAAHRGVGVGRLLKNAQIEAATALGFHSLIGEALDTNPQSIELNLSAGFRVVGTIEKAGYRDGAWISLVVMQRTLKEDSRVGDHRTRISVITDDLDQSVLLYRNALGLDMLPLSNPIGIFPMGDADLQVCLREVADELLGLDLPPSFRSSVVLTRRLDTSENVERAVSAAREFDIGPVVSGFYEATVSFTDFNGVTWLLTLR